MATILLVEDDRFLSDTIRTFLEFKEHLVDRAFEGLEALEKMKFGVYDLIILDWQLPGMNGVDICHAYRTGGGVTPVLMLSGRTDPKEMRKATDAGANGFVSKPFKLDALEKTIDNLLNPTATK